MKEKKRKCRGCEKFFNRDELVKITKLQDGTLKINPASNELGRSVYVCKNEDCIKKFIKKKRLKTALRYANIEEIERVENSLCKIVEELGRSLK